MKRDARLRGLSSEHHQALVLARRLADAAATWTADDGEALARRFALELEPHFLAEDEVLLPALRAAGALELAERAAADHTFLRATLREVRAGDGRAARAFGERLQDHVRFEERELFPACEALLADAVLDEVALRSAAPPAKPPEPRPPKAHD